MRKLAQSFQQAISSLLPAASPEALEHLSFRPWRLGYWIYAGVLPGALFTFAAVKIWLYHVARAPNVGLLAQITFTGLFYLAWLVVPRLIWTVIHHELQRPDIRYERLVLRLGGMGVALLVGHMFLWTLIHVTMYASAAWAWQPIHLLHVFGEVWLDQAGLWLLAYMSTAAICFLMMTQTPEPKRSVRRFEVKQNGKLMSIPLAQIYWFKAAGNYAELYTDRGVFTVRKTLSQIAKYIADTGFLKSHRGALVNASHVIAIKPDAEGGGYVVLFSNEMQAPLSRRKLTEFRNLLSMVD